MTNKIIITSNLLQYLPGIAGYEQGSLLPDGASLRDKKTSGIND